jgi:subtilase family serine protease
MHPRFRRVLGVIAFTPALIASACAVQSEDESQVQSAVTTGPDLIESSVQGPASNLSSAAGGTFNVADTTTNQGNADSVPSTTGFYLTSDGTTKTPNGRLAQRSVGAITAGNADASPSTAMTIPTGIPDGPYMVLACADTPGTNTETDESNNCSVATQGATTTSFVVTLASPNLVETSISNPPPTLALGDTFVVTDTVANQGGGDAGTTTTRFYLSADGTAKTKFLGERAVGPLVATTGTDGPTDTTVTVPPGTAGTSYFLMACADDKLNVGESNERDNCIASTMATNVSGPNLVESGVALDTNTVGVDGKVKITESTDNTGNGPAGTSRTKIFISADATYQTAQDPQLLPTCAYPYYRAIPTLAAGASSLATTTASLCYRENGSTIVKHVQPGTYHLIACADANAEVSETIENDNCTDANTTLTVTPDATSKPDLVETLVQGPATDVTGGAGATFPITETASNQGTADAVASTTTFYLSSNGTTNTANGRLAQRSVPALPVNTQSTVTTSMLIPAGIPDGDYVVRVCADTPGTNQEINEANNCTVALEGTSANQLVVHISSPDYVISSISEPPPSGLSINQGFSVTDTTTNQGLGDGTVNSTTRYYLSNDGVAKTKLVGQRTVGPLAAGASNGPFTTTATVPAGTLQGSYYLLACADDKLNIGESNEKNNCRASTTAVMVSGPNLVEENVTVTPGTVSASTGSVTLTETVHNIGNATAGASRTRLYVSTDATKSPDDVMLLPGCVYPYYRSINSLIAGDISPSSISAQMCYRDTSTNTNQRLAPGTYHIFACADDTKIVAETVENDNCTEATTTITVTP